ncbi:hypothetical protein BH09ACT12_BH09ACT12_26940 [soil metagenome]
MRIDQFGIKDDPEAITIAARVWALATADSAVVITHGEEVLRSAAADLLVDQRRVEAAYLGSAAAA